MIVIESNQKVDSIVVLIDSDGVNELINYLNYVKKNDESMHLTAGNELDETPISEGVSTVKHVKLVYLKSNLST